jgi:hypothetical protein
VRLFLVKNEDGVQKMDAGMLAPVVATIKSAR